MKGELADYEEARVAQFGYKPELRRNSVFSTHSRSASPTRP